MILDAAVNDLKVNFFHRRRLAGGWISYQRFRCAKYSSFADAAARCYGVAFTESDKKRFADAAAGRAKLSSVGLHHCL